MNKKIKFLIKLLIILLIIFLVFILYSYFIGTSGLKVKEYKIENKNIPYEFNGLKIIHISDIHYGKHFNEKKLKKVVTIINEINPDIVVFTGDLADKNISKEDEQNLIKLLSKINYNIGKYAVTGNHDYDNFENIMKESNFKVLNNTYEIIYGKDSKIMLSGVSTNWHDDNINKKLESTNDYLTETNVNYKILLIHEPDFINNINNQNFDLILSGHSHNGQVRLPFIGAIWTPRGSKRYYKNYYKVNNSDLYISSGLGTSGLNLRLFNKPSINFYRLVSK